MSDRDIYYSHDTTSVSQTSDRVTNGRLNFLSIKITVTFYIAHRGAGQRKEAVRSLYAARSQAAGAAFCAHVKESRALGGSDERGGANEPVGGRPV